MSLYDDASLIMYPSGYKSGKIYCQKPTDGSGDLTFTRASTATYIDANGARQTAASGVPRIDFSGGGCGKLLLEPQRTNLLLNSATLSTQNITTTAQSYVLTFEGTGTVTLSGTYSGSLVGTGSTPADRVSLVFTATAGTLTVTVSGSVLNAQTEAGTYPTSYIPTAGSTITRVRDDYSLSNVYTNGLIGASGGCWFIHIKNNTVKGRDLAGNGLNLSQSGTTSSMTNGFKIGNDSGTPNRLYVSRVLGGAYLFYLTTADEVKLAITWNGSTYNIWQNGVKVVSAGVFTFTAMEYLAGQNGDVAKNIVNQMLFSSVPSDATIIELTTL